jgi:hypothetical protein
MIDAANPAGADRVRIEGVAAREQLELPPRHVLELGRVHVRHRPGWLSWKSAR